MVSQKSLQIQADEVILFQQKIEGLPSRSCSLHKDPVSVGLLESGVGELGAGE